MAKVKLSDWTVMGRVVGQASGWDQNDTFSMMLYNFKPANGINLPSGDISIDFEGGLVCTFDEDGKELTQIDLVDALKSVPRSIVNPLAKE